MDGFDTRLLGEPAEDPIMGLLQQQYGGQQAAAPVAQAAAPQYAPVSQAAQVSGDPQSLATLASRFQNELAQLGWTGGDPVIYDYTPGGESGQDFRATPVGVKPEFEQFLQGKNLQVALDPSGGGYRVSLLAGGQPIGQYLETQSKSGWFERFMNQFQPLAVNALLAVTTGGALNAALVGAGLSASTAATVARAIAPTVVQAAATGNVDLDTAARNVVASLVAPQVANEIASQIPADRFVQRAAANAIGSAIATGMQQGADLNDILRNAAAGGLTPVIGQALREAGVDDTALRTGISRAIGTYVSTGDVAGSVVSGLTRYMTEEQKLQAEEEKQAGKTLAPQESVAQQGAPTAPAEAGAPLAAGETQQIPVTTQPEAVGPSAADIQQAIRNEQVTSPAAAPVPQLPVTASKPPVAADEPFSDVAPSFIPPPAAPVPVAPAPQQVEVTGQALPAIPSRISDEEVFTQLQREVQPATPPEIAPPPAAPAAGEMQTQTIIGARQPDQTITSAADLQTDVARPAPPPTGQVDQPRIEISGQQPASIPLTRQEDLQQQVFTAPMQTVEVTGKQPQTIGITGQRISDEDLISYIMPAEPEPAAQPPAAAPAPAPSGGVAPTDIFSFVRRGRPTPMTVARLASMDFPMGRTVGTGGFTPAGELEPGGSTKPRQPVWNEASLRLKDALGL